MRKLHALLLIPFSLSLTTACVAQTGIITTIGGNNAFGAGYSGDGGQATSAELNNEEGVALDKAGNLYIADQNNNRIRKINTSGVISTFAGTGVAGFSGDGAQATSARISNPNGVRVDSSGNVYIADAGNGLIRKVLTTGVINTICGRNGFGGYSGDGGQATLAEINYPVGLGIDHAQNIYIADAANNVIRKIATTGIISTVAGNFAAGPGFSGNGGPATSAEMNNPLGVAVDNAGTLYIADQQNNEIRMVDGSGMISDYAGDPSGAAGFNGTSGTANVTQIYNPNGVSVDQNGNVYLSDPGDGFVREVFAVNGIMTVIAGNGTPGYSGDNGQAVNAMVNYPFDLVPDANNNLYIADLNNNVIRKITVGCASDTTSTFIANALPCSNSSNGIIEATSNSGSMPYTYLWSTGATDMLITGLSAGTYSVTLVDAIGCSKAASVSLTAPPALVAHVNPNDTVCAGIDVLLSSSGSGGVMPYSYTWNTSWGFDTLTVQAVNISSYTIYVNDSNGCVDSASTMILVNALPSLSISFGLDTVCSNENLDTLIGSPAGGVFSGPGVTGNNFDATTVSQGTYVITYTYTDSVHCTNTKTDSINVQICTGIKTVMNGARVEAYPNPANDVLNVVISNYNVAALGLFTLTGQEITETVPANKQTVALPVSQLNAGIYILKVTLTDGSVMRQKVEIAR